MKEKDAILLRTRVRHLLERLLRVQIAGRHTHGHRECNDIKRSGCAVNLVFDVGANVGQSVLKFTAEFPAATILSFEPVTRTFHILQETVGSFPNVQCHQLAMGGSDGKQTIYLTGEALTNSLVPPDEPSESEEVTVRSVDSFAAEHHIERIDVLKIDAEGFDLEVLKGAQGMLSSNRIAFVLVEVGFDPASEEHIVFDDFRSFLLPLGFSLFGIYEQQLEWSGEQKLRFANACFANSQAFSPPG